MPQRRNSIMLFRAVALHSIKTMYQKYSCYYLCFLMSPQVFMVVIFDQNEVYLYYQPSHFSSMFYILCLNLFAKLLFFFIELDGSFMSFYNYKFIVCCKDFYLTFKMLTSYVYEQSWFVTPNNGFDSLSGMS